MPLTQKTFFTRRPPLCNKIQIAFVTIPAYLFQSMPDLQDGESTEMQGSGAKPYLLKNTGGVRSFWNSRRHRLDRKFRPQRPRGLRALLRAQIHFSPLPGSHSDIVEHAHSVTP